MDFLFNNPIANMQGTTFLAFYAVTITTAFILFWAVRKRLDWTTNMPLPPIPNPIDPYETAFLRGGGNELARFVTFSLREKGFLVFSEIGGKTFVSQNPLAPNWTNLPEIERDALPWFQRQTETKDIFGNLGLEISLAKFIATYEQRLRQANFLIDDGVRTKVNLLKAAMITFLLGLGVYKFIVAIFLGKSNVMFLILFMFICFIIGLALKGMPRVSSLGQSYLDSLRNAFGGFGARPIGQQNSFGAVDPMLLAFGVIGSAALYGTMQAEYDRAFKASASTSGGCGASCGSSCSSGGDGGGGCGGGGCGGCS